MSNYNKTTNQDNENVNGENFSEVKRNENREFFKRALAEVIDAKIREAEEENVDIEIKPPSKRHKIRMNRLYRERVSGIYLPFPEVDNFYEKVRSKLIVKLKINKFLDRREEHRRRK